MKHNRSLKILVMVMCLISIVLAACGSSNPVLGKWEATDGSGDTIEFFDDDTFVMSSTMGLNVSGTYSIDDSDQIKMEMEGLLGIAGPIIATLSDSGKTLTLTISGVDAEFKKAK